MASKQKGIIEKYFDSYVKEFKKSRKRSAKMTKKLMNADVKIKKNFYKRITSGPKKIEFILTVLFIIVVFFLFWKKSKNPEFLSNISK